MAAQYTVVVRGKTFLLSKSQIEFDAPNLFSNYFFGNKSDPLPKNSIELSRNPDFFTLILDYLCGYTILPVPTDLLPSGASPSSIITNLRVDAEFYELKGLKERIDKYLRVQSNEGNNPQENSERSRKSTDLLPCFHFTGRVTNWVNWDRWAHYPSGYIEFPLVADLSKSFTITCWYKARSKDGWHTLISIDAPSAARPLLYISISPGGDFRFEIGTNSVPDRFSSEPSQNQVGLNVWTHLAFTQLVSEDGLAGRRTLYINGVELVSTSSNPAIYNPAPSQTRMAVMRGAWDHHRTAGFIGQAENVAVYQFALNQNEILARASHVDAPADHGWPVNNQMINLY